MRQTDLPNYMSPGRFSSLLARYPDLVPTDLIALDTQRYTQIPSRVRSRRQTEDNDRNKDGGGAVWLEKDELVELVRWKLKHGTFRPSLLNLASSNPAPVVKSTTQRAFSLLSSSSSSAGKPTASTIDAALKTLTELKGIGPATASLLLSVADASDYTPFFSDELFLWLTWDESNATASSEAQGHRTKGADEWKARKIGYKAAEYKMLVQRFGELKERFGGETRAVEAEKVAWVLRRVGDQGEEEEDGEADAGALGNGKQRVEKVPAKKRKDRDVEEPDAREGDRSRKRLHGEGPKGLRSRRLRSDK